MTTNANATRTVHAERGGLGAVTLDLQRVTLDELARLFKALQTEVKRRHAQ